MKQVPYTTSTGVKIGSRHNESPKPMPIDDPDMETIQGWFILPPELHRQRKIEKIVLRLSILFVLVILLSSLMVSK
jgi:hypothetical protein